MGSDVTDCFINPVDSVDIFCFVNVFGWIVDIDCFLNTVPLLGVWFFNRAVNFLLGWLVVAFLVCILNGFIFFLTGIMKPFMLLYKAGVVLNNVVEEGVDACDVKADDAVANVVVAAFDFS